MAKGQYCPRHNTWFGNIVPCELCQEERAVAFWDALQKEIASWEAITEPEAEADVPDIFSNAHSASPSQE